MCSHVGRLFAGMEDGQSSYCWLRLDLSCRKHSLVLSGITRLLPIDRTNGYDYSHRSLANNPFGSSPTPFASIVHSYRLLGIFPDRGSLTKGDMSYEFCSHLLIANLVVVVTLCDVVRFGCFHWHQVL